MGEKTRLHCGFPLQVGFVDLETGEEITRDKVTMTIAMGVNALIGISLTLFPLVFIYVMMP
jgi:presenilin-like A22 family membrane protease